MKNGNIKTKATKLIALLLLLCTLTLMLSSCGGEKIEKPEDTNLEYWLLDRPNKKEWTELSNSHWLDDRYYLASRYEPIIDENGNLSKPTKHVLYVVGDYPLDDLGVKRITAIYITDPDVYVWGLTINSSRDEVKSILNKNGFIKHQDTDDKYIVRKENYTVIVEYGHIIKIMYSTTSLIEQILILGYGK